MEQEKSEQKKEQWPGKYELPCCERCNAELPLMSERTNIKLVGNLSVQLCRACLRLWEINTLVLANVRQLNRHEARCSAFVQAGDADNAAAESDLADDYRRELRNYALAWLKGSANA